MLRRALEEFRSTHPLRHAGAVEYVAGGRGGPALVVLPGGIGTAESAMGLVRALETDRRVLAVGYPPVDSMDAAADAVARVLDAEGIARADILGPSYGGMVAQCFLRRHPERIRKVVLSNTVAPDPALGVTTAKWVRRLGHVPAPLLRRLMAIRIASLYRGNPSRVFWKEYAAERFGRQDRRELLTMLTRVADFNARRFLPAESPIDAGRMLILDSERDELVTPEQRRRVRALYPGASSHTFAGAGHLVAATRRPEYLGVVRAFLDGSASTNRQPGDLGGF